jgi:predicted permease
LENFALIVVCLLAGVVMLRLRLLPVGSHKSINAWIINLAMPALSLRYVPYIDWGYEYILPIIGPVLAWVGAVVFVKLYSRFNQIDKATKTAMLLTSALANTAFMGLPMITAFYGAEQLPIAIVFDQVTFLFFSVLGVATLMKATATADMTHVYRRAVLKTLHFPPFVACMAGLILPHFVDISPANKLLEMLAATLSPMALFSIGMQLRLSGLRGELKHLVAAVGYKLIIAPLIVVLAALALDVSGNQAKVSTMQASMPTHVTISLLTAEYGQNPNFCTLMVGVSILLSFATSSLWYTISEMLF